MNRSFTSRPITIEALQFVGGKDNVHAIQDWVRDRSDIAADQQVFITKGMSQGPQAWHYIRNGQTWSDDIVAAVFDVLHETWVGVKKGQWIIRGTKGEFYPCDPEVFAEKYAPGQPADDALLAQVMREVMGGASSMVSVYGEHGECSLDVDGAFNVTIPQAEALNRAKGTT